MDAHLARRLASTEQEERDQALDEVEALLQSTGGDLGGEEEYCKLWKALFFCFWMADKPLYQNEVAQRLAKLVRFLELQECEKEEEESAVNRDSGVIKFFRGFWLIMGREWRGIDRHRLNKYYLLMRHMLMAGFQLMAQLEWEEAFVGAYNTRVIMALPMAANLPEYPDSIRIFVGENYLALLRECQATPIEKPSQIKERNSVLQPIIQGLATQPKRNVLTAMATAVMEAPLEEAFDVQDLAKALFEAGSSPSVATRNRTVLYSLSQQLKATPTSL